MTEDAKNTKKTNDELFKIACASLYVIVKTETGSTTDFHIETLRTLTL